jgi:hypothetical protein
VKIQLLYFVGCPHVEPARAALRAALVHEGLGADVEEIDVNAAGAPAWARGWGSPTILIDGEDVAGERGAGGSSCRLYAGGAPSLDRIRAGLRAAGRQSEVS